MPASHEHHGAVVLGAGPGARVTAAMLSEAGLQTLVLERDLSGMSREARRVAKTAARAVATEPDRVLEAA